MFTVTASGAKFRLELAERPVADPRLKLNDIRDFLKGVWEKNIAAGGRPVKWKPLDPVYLAAKMRQGYPRDILVKTGWLRDSIRGTVDENGVTFVATAPHAPMAMETRPVFTLADEDRLVIEQILEREAESIEPPRTEDPGD